MDFLGVGSNMDLGSIVEQLIAIERQPIVRFESKKKDYVSKQSVWRDVNTRLSALRNSLDNLKLTSDFTKVKTTTSDDKVVTATADAKATFADYEIKVIQLAKTQKVKSAKFDASITEDTTFYINGKSVTVNASVEDQKTLIDIAKAINATEDIGVIASVVDNHLILEAKDTNVAINLFDDGTEDKTPVDNQFFETIGLLTEVEGELQANILQQEQGSKVEINGILVERDTNVIDDAVVGVKLTLRKESQEKVTVNVNKDIDSIVNNIKAFVEEYKKVQSFLDSQTAFTQGLNGEANTTGKLFGDSTVNALKSKLRSLFTGVVEGIEGNQIKMLSQIGISVDRYGAVTLDETKLREAITEKPEEVALLFTKKDTGLANKLQSFTKSYTESKGIIDGKVSFYEERIKDVNKSVERLEERVEMKRTSLIRQFAALDKAMGALYSQGDWLGTQLTMMINSTRR